MEKRGGVWIAPQGFVPSGRMVDPADAPFWASWQDDSPLQDEVITGAEAAIAWGRERAPEIWIRLGHTGDTYFSAGADHPDNGCHPPPWPPAGPPPEGWWYPPPPPALSEVRDVAASFATRRSECR